MDLSREMRGVLREALTAAGDATEVKTLALLGGGSISRVLRVDTGQAAYVLKLNEKLYPNACTVEASGLSLLRETGAVRVPQVYAVQDTYPAFLLQEYIGKDGRPGSPNPEILGRQLALLHQHGSSTGYGLDYDNYIGAEQQVNGWDEDWIRFFRDRRLRYQVDLAVSKGRMPRERRQRAEKVMERLPKLLGSVERRPSLLHGDLWGGNVIASEQEGEPVLIDPAVYYGDREAEIAFTHLFGGFSDRFYETYNETWPLEPGFERRLDLYNLYHLLNHLNIFGEGYGGQVDQVLREYT
jgi:protein-ribulosamine 3-kinase